MKPSAIFICALFWFGASMHARAETRHVDDSQSQVLGPTLRLKPLAPYSAGAQANVVTGNVTVAVRLDVAAWKGRKGRIYMTLPEQSAGAVTASWATRGRLMPGVVSNGGRTPVYAGLIQGDTIEDTLRLTIQADDRKLPRSSQLAFAFEIDLGTP
jgi:hypothetical protein